jgi:excisionase family DNA binding protein
MTDAHLPRECINAKDVAARLGVSLSTVYRLLARGQLPPPERINRKAVFWREDPGDGPGWPELPADPVTPKQAARALGCDRSTIHRLAKAGRLRACKVGGRLWLSRAELPVPPRGRLDAKAAARLLGCGITTVYRLARQGALGSWRAPGRRWWFSRAEVAALAGAGRGGEEEGE